ncbi:unnamed protein product [Closterium sp. Naga37s-1]|nr:unnamed protein product [Closterium sp. Naga37s-1]
MMPLLLLICPLHMRPPSHLLISFLTWVISSHRLLHAFPHIASSPPLSPPLAGPLPLKSNLVISRHVSLPPPYSSPRLLCSLFLFPKHTSTFSSPVSVPVSLRPPALPSTPSRHTLQHLSFLLPDPATLPLSTNLLFHLLSHACLCAMPHSALLFLFQAATHCLAR